jgi:hypothetical protein
MIPLIGLLIAFYVAMRGLDWINVAKEARHSSVYWGRVVIGALTFLGAGVFTILLISASASAPSLAPTTEYTQ